MTIEEVTAKLILLGFKYTSTRVLSKNNIDVSFQHNDMALIYIAPLTFNSVLNTDIHVFTDDILPIVIKKLL